MTNEINHTQAFMNLVTILVILGGIGILWSNFLDWLNQNEKIKENKKTKKKTVAAKKMKTKRGR
jgi:hypothetical protein